MTCQHKASWWDTLIEMALIFYVLGFSILMSCAAAQVDRKCLDCICKIESSCRPLGCSNDAGSLSCGYYQLKSPYYIDCGQPGKKNGESTEAALERCGKDKGCSETCVQAYMRRYASRCHSPPTCEVYARVHNGGPMGCRSSSTLGYWNKIQQCLK